MDGWSRSNGSAPRARLPARLSPPTCPTKRLPSPFLDITAVFEQKRRAMEAMAAQAYLCQYYTERAVHCALHARRAAGNAEIKFAEAFQCVLAQEVTML